MSKYILTLPYVLFAFVIVAVISQVPAAIATTNAMETCDKLENRFDRGACYSEHFKRGN